MKRDIDKELKEAIEELERITADPETRELYYQREKELRDMISMVSDNWEEGMKKGIEKGEKQKEIFLIQSMYRKGINIEKICDIAELSKEEVEEIIKEHKD